MNDQEFLETLNRIAREKQVTLGRIQTGGDISVQEMDRWATFLGWCLNEGISLSDARWSRITIQATEGHSEFHLRDLEGTHDSNFRVGLQLLIGLLAGYESARGRSDEIT